GCLGTQNRTEYSVIGHAVNLAARLESAARPGQILLGPETETHLRHTFRLRKLGKLALKGIAEPITITELQPTTTTAPLDGAFESRESTDQLLNVKDAAKVLNVSTPWLYKHADELPFTVRSAGRLQFSYSAMQAYLLEKERKLAERPLSKGQS